MLIYISNTNHMNPQPIYSQATETQTLVSIITSKAEVEKIVLLGQTMLQTTTETVFTNTPVPVRSTAHYFLLVLVKKDEEHTLNCIQDKIENNLQHFIPATAIVLSINTFNQWFKQGHPFAHLVVTKAQKLYDNEAIQLDAPAVIDEAEQQKQNEELFKQTKRNTGSFLAGAELYKIRKDYKLAAFMLHQAAEQALRTMLIINTGLKINTHSIDKLTRYCSMFCHGLSAIFPKNNEKEKKLFTLLNKAYIDARYKHDYTITYEELTCLTGRVKKLIELFLFNGCHSKTVQ